MELETVGIIGVGLLGSAIARRLRNAGYGVLGFDLDPSRLRGIEGAAEASSAVEVARGSRRIFLCLPASDVSATVVESIRSCLSAGSVVIDAATGEPDAMAAAGASLSKTGIQYLDATVGGSSKVVLAGEAIVMAGGPAEVFEDCCPLFATFAGRIFHVGAWGAGARMKLVMNLALGLNRAVLAEALSFASACGVSPRLALEILKAGPAYSKAMDAKGEKMLRDDFTPEARLSQHLKDVRLILAEAARHGASVPLSEVHLTLLDRAVAAGYGDADNSAILRAYTKNRKNRDRNTMHLF